MAVFAITCLTIVAQGQPINKTVSVKESTTDSKPYRIHTIGKQVAIKSNIDIKNIMVWTSGGNRILEKKEINTANYSFRVAVTEKIFFVMLRLADGKTYSEKIGIE